jgi:hypothetical protein
MTLKDLTRDVSTPDAGTVHTSGGILFPHA